MYIKKSLKFKRRYKKRTNKSRVKTKLKRLRKNTHKRKTRRYNLKGGVNIYELRALSQEENGKKKIKSYIGAFLESNIEQNAQGNSRRNSNIILKFNDIGCEKLPRELTNNKNEMLCSILFINMYTLFKKYINKNLTMPLPIPNEQFPQSGGGDADKNIFYITFTDLESNSIGISFSKGGRRNNNLAGLNLSQNLSQNKKSLTVFEEIYETYLKKLFFEVLNEKLNDYTKKTEQKGGGEPVEIVKIVACVFIGVGILACIGYYKYKDDGRDITECADGGSEGTSFFSRVLSFVNAGELLGLLS